MSVEFGKYQLLKKLARGGMGQVFLARSDGAKGFEKLLVIKRILPHLIEDEEFLNMFFDEARLAARLNHPNIAQIFELGDVEGSHYIAMEYVAGEDVRRLERHAIKMGKPLPLGLICRIIADAAGALDHAHKAKDGTGQPMHVVHRDVSPQNILVGFDGGVKLIDFGVARAAGRIQLTTSGVLKGKYPYMSPEQMDGQTIDHRSDIFALGIVFWELLTGKRLFKGDDDLMTMRLVRECIVPLPSSINPKLPKKLDPVVMESLARSPDNRYDDAQAKRKANEDFPIPAPLHATSAHHAAYMKELYPDPITQDESKLDELQGDVALDDAPSSKGTPASSSKLSKATKSSAGPGKATNAGKAPQESSDSRMPYIVLALVLLVVVLGGGLGYRYFVHDAQAHVDPKPVVQQPDVAQVKPPVVEDVVVRLRSTPPGAQVFEESTQVGTTPVDLKFSKSKVHPLSFKLNGYTSVERALDLSHLTETSTQLDVTLEAIAVKPPPGTNTTKKPKRDTDVHIFE